VKARGLLVGLVLLAAACRTGGPARPPEAGHPEAGPPEAGHPEAGHEEGPPPLPVKKASEEVVVAAWSEPKQLPTGGGQSQILVRAQKRGGPPFAGVEVRIQVEGGTLYSKGQVLITDAAGRTRDRLTARRPALITVNAGGTVYRFRVPLRTPDAADSRPD
jgi:hypothetical protein